MKCSGGAYLYNRSAVLVVLHCEITKSTESCEAGTRTRLRPEHLQERIKRGNDGVDSFFQMSPLHLPERALATGIQCLVLDLEVLQIKY